MFASAKHLEYAQQGLTPKEIMALTGCNRRSAKEALQSAEDQIMMRMSRGAESAVELLERSSLMKSVKEAQGGSVVSKRRWEDVALGLTRGN